MIYNIKNHRKNNIISPINMKKKTVDEYKGTAKAEQ
jgi:hypothetical protein